MSSWLHFPNKIPASPQYVSYRQLYINECFCHEWQKSGGGDCSIYSVPYHIFPRGICWLTGNCMSQQIAGRNRAVLTLYFPELFFYLSELILLVFFLSSPMYLLDFNFNSLWKLQQTSGAYWQVFSIATLATRPKSPTHGWKPPLKRNEQIKPGRGLWNQTKLALNWTYVFNNIWAVMLLETIQAVVKALMFYVLASWLRISECCWW